MTTAITTRAHTFNVKVNGDTSSFIVEGTDGFSIQVFIELLEHFGKESVILDAVRNALATRNGSFLSELCFTSDGLLIGEKKDAEPNSAVGYNPFSHWSDPEANEGENEPDDHVFHFTDARFETFEGLCEERVPIPLALSAAIASDENEPVLGVVASLNERRCAIQIDKKTQETTLGLYVKVVSKVGRMIADALFSKFGSVLSSQRKAFEFASMLDGVKDSLIESIPEENVIPLASFLNFMKEKDYVNVHKDFEPPEAADSTARRDVEKSDEATRADESWRNLASNSPSFLSRYINAEDKTTTAVVAVLVEFIAAVDPSMWRGVSSRIGNMYSSDYSLTTDIGYEKASELMEVLPGLVVDVSQEVIPVIIETGTIHDFTSAFHEISRLTLDKDVSRVSLSAVLAVYNFRRHEGDDLTADIIISLADLPTDPFEAM